MIVYCTVQYTERMNAKQTTKRKKNLYTYTINTNNENEKERTNGMNE